MGSNQYQPTRWDLDLHRHLVQPLEINLHCALPTTPHLVLSSTTSAMAIRLMADRQIWMTSLWETKEVFRFLILKTESYLNWQPFQPSWVVTIWLQYRQLWFQIVTVQSSISDHLLVDNICDRKVLSWRVNISSHKNLFRHRTHLLRNQINTIKRTPRYNLFKA